jgi:energy-coupling factor transporter ATP-binding protein EcfA2
MIVAVTGRTGSGKTTLTRALTGIDSADLPSEARGGLWVSPAQRYITSMTDGTVSTGAAADHGVGFGAGAVLALLDGAACARARQAHWDAIDVVLWLVDASDDVDAQIDAEAFGAQGCKEGVHAIVVLTQLDTLTPPAADQARSTLRQRVRANGDADIAIYETCATDPFDAGVHALRHHLAALGASMPIRPPRTLAVAQVLTYEGAAIRVLPVRAEGSERSGVTVIRSKVSGTWLVDATDCNDWSDAVLAALRDHHAHAPHDEGLAASLLHRQMKLSMPQAAWQALIEMLSAGGRIVRSGACVQTPEHRRTVSEPENVPVSGIVADVAAGRFNPPWVRDIAALRQLPEGQVRRILQQLAHEGRVYEVVPDLFYDRFQVAILARLLHSLAQLGVGSTSGAKGEVAAAIFRDATGVGRKRAIQILEFFDRIGFTQRIGDSHCVEPASDWARWFDIPPEGPATTLSQSASAGVVSGVAVSGHA